MNTSARTKIAPPEKLTGSKFVPKRKNNPAKDLAVRRATAPSEMIQIVLVSISKLRP